MVSAVTASVIRATVVSGKPSRDNTSVLPTRVAAPA